MISDNDKKACEIYKMVARFEPQIRKADRVSGNWSVDNLLNLILAEFNRGYLWDPLIYEKKDEIEKKLEKIFLSEDPKDAIKLMGVAAQRSHLKPFESRKFDQIRSNLDEIEKRKEEEKKRIQNEKTLKSLPKFLNLENNDDDKRMSLFDTFKETK